MLKASREAKTRTSWSDVSAGYEEALTQFIRAILEPREGNLFFAELQDAQRLIARFGLYNSLSQTLSSSPRPACPTSIRETSCGICSLVDPDNRRPVDYELRRGMLARACDSPRSMRIGMDRAKLYLTWKTLQFRRANETLFREAPIYRRGSAASMLRTSAHSPDGTIPIRSDDRATAVFAAAGKS